MRGRDAARKSIKVNILQVFTIDFSEIQFLVNHNSQSDGQNKSAKRWTNLQEKTVYIISLQRKRKDSENGILTLSSQAKNGPLRLRSDFRADVSLKKIVSTASQAKKVEEPISPEQYRRWHPSSSTSWWDKSEWNWI